MYIVLSQKIDTDSTYSDKLFETYHFPARYRNQIHTGDIFIYYQGNRLVKEQRYYFGSGIVGKIYTTDEESYFAELTNCKTFENKVPIYLKDGGYIEQKGYESVRNRPNPPWQSSIRPISREAYNFIMSNAGEVESLKEIEDIEQLKTELKKSIKAFYLGADNAAILSVAKTAKEIISALSLEPTNCNSSKIEYADTIVNFDDSKKSLFDYCKNLRMSYSYKPILIMAVIDAKTTNGMIPINDAVRYFRNYYKNRSNLGLKIEKNNCIYQDLSVSDEEIAGNILANPVKALMSSGYFAFDSQNMYFGFSPEVWFELSDTDKAALRSVCVIKLEKYYLYK